MVLLLTWSSFAATSESSFDMWVGCVSELVSYFDTCQADYSDLDSVQDITELFRMLLSYLTSILTSSRGWSYNFKPCKTTLMRKRGSRQTLRTRRTNQYIYCKPPLDPAQGKMNTSSSVQSYGSETVQGWQKFIRASLGAEWQGLKAMISADHTGHSRPCTLPENELTAVTQHFHRTCLTLYETTCVLTADYCQSNYLKLNQAADRLQGHNHYS